MSFNVTKILSPEGAAMYTGRFEDDFTRKDGKTVKVTRSLRHAALNEMLLQGNITPTKAIIKAPVPAVNAVDDLCDLFQTKAKVTKSKQTQDAPKGENVKPAKEAASKVEGILRTKAPKASASSLSPVRRSGRLSNGARTRFGGVKE